MMSTTNPFFVRHATMMTNLAVTLVMIGATILFYLQGQTSNNAKGWVVHTYAVTGHIQLLFNRIKDVELGQRGYIISGKEEYLTPYRDALKDSLGADATSDRLEQHHSIAEEMKILRKLTSDSSIQQQNLDELDSYIKELLEYWATTTHAKKIKLNETYFHQEYELMDHLRSLVGIMMATENNLLEKRIKDDEISTHKDNVLIFSGIAVFYLAMLTSIRLYNRSRKRASAESVRYTRMLEDNQEQLKKQQAGLQELITKLALSNTQLDEFAYIASHDLKAPLRVIDNASKWLEEDLQEHLSGENRENMTMLRGRVRRMEKLLDDLLEYSRVGRAEDERYREILAGNALMDGILELLSPAAGFKVQVSPNFASISVNRMPLQQILMNLISNAIKHHDKKQGTIEVTVEDAVSDYLFVVRDDGPGIAPQFHDQVFKMFQTLKPRDQVEGSGMGLAMVRKNVEIFGGMIQLDSAEGKGSAFRFTWPKQQKLKG